MLSHRIAWATRTSQRFSGLAEWPLLSMVECQALGAQARLWVVVLGSHQGCTTICILNFTQRLRTNSHIHIAKYIFASAMDPARDLNNFLQHFRDGRGNNLTRHFSWVTQSTGPDNQKVHYATAKLHGQIIGTGSGISIGNAKNVAAAHALPYVRSLPPGHRLLSLW